MLYRNCVIKLSVGVFLQAETRGGREEEKAGGGKEGRRGRQVGEGGASDSFGECKCVFACVCLYMCMYKCMEVYIQTST